MFHGTCRLETSAYPILPSTISKVSPKMASKCPWVGPCNILTLTQMLSHEQTVNQIEMHPLLLQNDLVNFCNEQKIHIISYSPLGNNSACPIFAYQYEFRKSD